MSIRNRSSSKSSRLITQKPVRRQSAMRRSARMQRQRASRMRQSPASVHIVPHVSVIIPVMNERRTIAAVIRQAIRVDRNTEVIAVVNGSRDGSAAIARKAGAKVILFDQPLGHDVGRSIGASHARGNILLFLDGDIVVPTRVLAAFVQAVEQGTDVALNDYSGPTNKEQVHSVVLAKHVWNAMLGRPDLKGTSMTTIPHAINRRALDVVGVDNLAIPPKAHGIAVHRGLKVKAVHEFPVGRLNPLRRRQSRPVDPVETLIVGDHLEAIRWLLDATDRRSGFTDLARHRAVMDWKSQTQ